MADVVDGARETGLRRQRDAEDHVADVADERERQQTLDVVLRDRAEDADDHREQTCDEQDVVEFAAREQQGVRPDDRVHTDLGQQAGEDGRDRRGRGGVGVGKPRRQREDRGLDTEGHEQHTEDRGPGAR